MTEEQKDISYPSEEPRSFSTKVKDCFKNLFDFSEYEFLPFIAFDPIFYASGIIDLDGRKYSFGTFVGSIPRAFFYSFLGWILISAQNIDLSLNLAEFPIEQVEVI